MSAIDVLFRHVTIIDGSGSPSIVGDVAIEGDRIAAIGSTVDPSTETEVIDGAGLALAPGFIDVHTHDDWALVSDPDMEFKTLQGVTSVVVGNCGVSIVPEDDSDFGHHAFPDFASYFAALEAAPPSTNVAALVGHGSIRSSIVGRQTDRPITEAEFSAMVERLERALDDGAIGISSGLAYEPGRYSDVAEMTALAQVVAEAGGIYTTHMRNEAGALSESIDEALEVAAASGVRLQISHLKAGGRENWGTVAAALSQIDDARSRGIDVMADQYPYTRGSTVLEQVVRAGALDGPSGFGHVMPDQVLIAGAPGRAEWEGRTLAELAATAGTAPRALADEMVAELGRRCIVVLDIMSEDDVRTVMVHPAVMVGSDGLVGGDKPHPRLHHTYPRVLGHYSRELDLLPLSDAVRRMTSLPAERFGFRDRGSIAPGAFADLTLFDAEAVIDTGTFSDPTTTPKGIVGVWVNGVRVVEDGHKTGRRPGRVVRR